MVVKTLPMSFRNGDFSRKIPKNGKSRDDMPELLRVIHTDLVSPHIKVNRKEARFQREGYNQPRYSFHRPYKRVEA